jgi:hypothetical protein
VKRFFQVQKIVKRWGFLVLWSHSRTVPAVSRGTTGRPRRSLGKSNAVGRAWFGSY